MSGGSTKNVQKHPFDTVFYVLTFSDLLLHELRHVQKNTSATHQNNNLNIEIVGPEKVIPPSAREKVYKEHHAAPSPFLPKVSH